MVFLFGAYKDETHGYLVIEYMHQGSLFDVLHNKTLYNVLSWKRRVEMMLDASRGMNYLHRHTPPIIHRDVKSLNFLVDDRWIVKVGDFGFSGIVGGTAKHLGMEILIY